MKRRTIRPMALAVAAAVTAMLATPASAAHISISSATFRTTAAELTFAEETGTVRAVCSVTLEGTMAARSLAKTAGARIGSLTRIVAAEAACTGEGEIGFETRELPTEWRYESYAGTLPTITAFRWQMVPPQIRYRIGLLRNIVCLYRPGGPGDEFRWLWNIDGFGNPYISGYQWRIAGIVGNPLSCPRILTATGAGGPVRTAEGATITVNLI